MADEQLTPEQILEEQKKNCIFCKIVSGEMEGKKVYEDEHFLAVLDIRPAALGHVLLLPKEHIPIIALLPQERLNEFFSLAGKLSEIVKQAMVVQKVTVFTASGAAAGQQAPHLLIHLIPREPGDGLDVLDLKQRTIDQADTLALGSTFQQATQQMLSYLGRPDLVEGGEAPQDKEESIQSVPASFEEVPDEQPSGPAPLPAAPLPAPPAEPQPEPPKEGELVEFERPNDALQAAIMGNPELKRLIIAEPGLVEDYVAKSENLKKLFEGVNIKALSVMLGRQEQATKKEQKLAKEMSDEELFAFVDGNEGLRTWLLEHPEELASNIGQNQKLKEFFEGVDIQALAKRYRGHRGVL